MLLSKSGQRQGGVGEGKIEREEVEGEGERTCVTPALGPPVTNMIGSGPCVEMNNAMLEEVGERLPAA